MVRRTHLTLRAEGLTYKEVQEQIAARIESAHPEAAAAIRSMSVAAPSAVEVGKNLEVEAGEALLTIELARGGRHLILKLVEKVGDATKEFAIAPSKDGKDLEVEFTNQRSFTKLGTKNPTFKMVL
jgi:hypothetical protein